MDRMLCGRILFDMQSDKNGRVLGKNLQSILRISYENVLTQLNDISIMYEKSDCKINLSLPVIAGNDILPENWQLNIVQEKKFREKRTLTLYIAGTVPWQTLCSLSYSFSRALLSPDDLY